jgi:Fe-S-cluster containining protein
MTLTRGDATRLEAAGHRDFFTEAANGDLRLTNRDGRCVFLEEGRCSAYADRPDGCRSYPLVLDLDEDRVVRHDFCPHADEFRFGDDDERRLRRSVDEELREAAKRLRRRAGALVGSFLLIATMVGAQTPGPSRPRAWEVWKDLASLAWIDPGDRVLMRSSYCRRGCARDRHAPGDSRFIRREGEEGVVFEASGPGAITRIWMTQGDGVSAELDPKIWIRIVVDGEIEVQLPLPEFFGGEVPPFEAPLTDHRRISGGGNVSYVPIPYRESCRLSLLDAEDAKIWWQVSYHELASAEGVESFSGEEDLAVWREMLSRPGSDPWRGGPYPTSSGELKLRRGRSAVIADYDRPGVLNGLVIRAPRDQWSDLELELVFDSELRVRMPLEEFFAIGRAGATPTRSLLIGATEAQDLYCYFPMPYFESATVKISRSRSAGPRKVPVSYAVRRTGAAPDPASGLFGATRLRVERSTPGEDLELLRLETRGKWVGLYAELGSVDGAGRLYLEGDERVYLDGSGEAQIHGTGVEDFIGGGFFFQLDDRGPVPFRRSLHGMTFDVQAENGGAETGMYRLLLTDAPVWKRSVRVTLECGPTNDLPLTARAVSYYYADSARRGRRSPLSGRRLLP